jgi:hypothetical protein
VPSVNSSSPRDVVAGGAGFAGVSSGVESCASPSSPSSLAGGRQPRSKMCLAAKRAGVEGMRSHPFQVMHDGPGPVGDWMLFCMGHSGTQLVQGHPRLGHNSLVPRAIVRFGTRRFSRVVVAAAWGSKMPGGPARMAACSNHSHLLPGGGW